MGNDISGGLYSTAIDDGFPWYFRAVAGLSKPSLLEELRAQAEAVRAHDAAARQPVEKAREEIDSSLWRAFRWFEEAMRHLEVIRPMIARQFQLGSILSLDRPQLDRGFVSFRRRGLALQEVLDHVEVYYRLTGPHPIVLRVHPGAATDVEARLRASTMQYRHENEQDDHGRARHAVFHVEPSMRASILFAPDYERQVIDVTLSNVDRFESVRLEFQPRAIDVSALEDLIRLILGEANSFLHRAPLALIKTSRRGA